MIRTLIAERLWWCVCCIAARVAHVTGRIKVWEWADQHWMQERRDV